MLILPLYTIWYQKQKKNYLPSFKGSLLQNRNYLLIHVYTNYIITWIALIIWSWCGTDSIRSSTPSLFHLVVIASWFLCWWCNAPWDALYCSCPQYCDALCAARGCTLPWWCVTLYTAHNGSFSLWSGHVACLTPSCCSEHISSTIDVTMF